MTSKENKKSKFDYEIEAFEEAFQALKNKKIVIYGTGRMTATLISELRGFNIVGLCDRDENLVGSVKYGKPILSQAEAELQGDIVIINTDSTYWNTIYKRIQKWNLPIYYRNGERATENEKMDKDCPYWKSSLQELEQKLEHYEIISFDVFDTLILRKVMFPFDVLGMVENRMRSKWKEIDFCSVRKLAESRSDYQTYDEIYKNLQEITGWNQEKIEFAKKSELEIERMLIAERKDIRNLCNRVIQKKEVYFVSDMYFSKETLCEFLQQIGIHAKPNQIIVSCEQRKSKKDGNLWSWYKETIVEEKSAIHIGDNKIADIEIPQKYGIDTYFIMSVAEMLSHSSMKDIVPNINSIGTSVGMGIICARLFNSPFSLNEKKGMVSFSDEKEAGFVLLGYAMYNFLLWLKKEAIGDGIEQILFFARDGYLLVPMYKKLCELLGEKVPEPIYLEISRRAIWAAATENEDDLYVVAKFPFAGDLKSYLKERFGVTVENQELERIKASELQADEKILKKFLTKYGSQMRENFRKEKENYSRYIASLNLKENIAVVDTMLYGTTQYYFEKFLKKKTKGYYFCLRKDEANQYIHQNDMKSCFQKKEDLTGTNCAMAKNPVFFDAFFTAPNGMLICVNEDLKFCYSEKMLNQQHFALRYEMLYGIMEYFEEIVNLQKRVLFQEEFFDPLFADELFGCMMNNGFEPTENMKKGFYFDNRILDDREVQIWE